MEAIVSDEDFEWVSQFSWWAIKGDKGGEDLWYAAREERFARGRQNRRTIRMHREIAARAGLPWSRQYDHRDGHGLNNQRGNIRPCTSTQNHANARKRRRKTSRFKGISWEKRDSSWRACIMINKKQVHLGQRKSEDAAHELYKAAAKLHFGEFARTD